MDGSDMDTETLLAMLSSLLHPQEVEDSVLLEALVNCQGDIEAAAKTLRHDKQPPKKRRKVSDKVSIDTWLKGNNSGDGDCNHPVSSGSLVPSPSPGPRSCSPGKPLSKVKNVTNTELMALLKPSGSSDAPTTKPQVPRLPPLTLTTSDMVAEHTPCTLHHSVLHPELACRLYYTLLHASQAWQRTRWWLADRVVQSSHSTSFYCRKAKNPEQEADMQQAAQYWYNGRPTEPPPVFPPPMEEACEIVERVVNAEMRKRSRFPLEWGGYPAQEGEEPLLWRANVAASNCYAGAKESVGFHSDQLTYLGPYPTIASLSLGVSRVFRLREVIPLDERDKRAARTYNVPLKHNSLIIMHASTQEVFKHSVPPQTSIDMFHPPFPPPLTLADDEEEVSRLKDASNARINITFRFYRPDFNANKTPRCKCGVPCILRPDMKNRYDGASVAVPSGENTSESGRKPVSTSGKRSIVAKYWWTCYAGAQNDGKGCNFWKVMDVKAEGRGPFVGDVATMSPAN
ncbi:hypothetical protein BD413DRAFT_500028 [Trametes elegans]|nr:hypothetical protein BD413DRAFT_500028 [Trametes elegans]